MFAPSDWCLVRMRGAELRLEAYGLSMVVEKAEVGLVSQGSEVLRRCSTDTLGPLKEISIKLCTMTIMSNKYSLRIVILSIIVYLSFKLRESSVRNR